MDERKKDILDKLLDELDAPCQFILAGIILNPEGIGFNELHREIRKQNNYSKLSRSALSGHLKHLQEKNLIENKIDEKSPLKFKPSNYCTSPHFRELSKGFVAQSVTPEDFIPLMMNEDVNEVTQHLMCMSIQHLSDCLKSILQTPENISSLNMFQFFYILETLMKAYRVRILEKNEESRALKVIHECEAKATKSLRGSS
jgi:DNA-binding HxlR family transcriptional regulator